MRGALHAFAADLKYKFGLPGSANPEDQLEGPTGDLAKAAGTTVGVSTKTEAHLSDHSVRTGDLLLIRSFTRFDAASERRLGEDRQAFAMVRRCDPRRGPLLRLVLDLGRPGDPDGAQRRPPGRPRKAAPAGEPAEADQAA